MNQFSVHRGTSHEASAGRHGRDLALATVIVWLLPTCSSLLSSRVAGRKRELAVYFLGGGSLYDDLAFVHSTHFSVRSAFTD